MDPYRPPDPLSNPTSNSYNMSNFVNNPLGPRPNSPNSVGGQSAKITMNIPSFMMPKIAPVVTKTLSHSASLEFPPHHHYQSTTEQQVQPQNQHYFAPKVTTPSIRSLLVAGSNHAAFSSNISQSQSNNNSSGENSTVNSPSHVNIFPSSAQDVVNSGLLSFNSGKGQEIISCSVPGCSSTESPTLQLFRIPSFDQGENWCDILGITSLKEDYHKLRICKLHFNESQFYTNDYREQILRADATPHAGVIPQQIIRQQPINKVTSGFIYSKSQSGTVTTTSSPSPSPSLISPSSSACSSRTESPLTFPNSNIQSKINLGHISITTVSAAATQKQTGSTYKPVVLSTVKNLKPVKPLIQMPSTNINAPSTKAGSSATSIVRKQPISPEKTNKLRGPKCFRKSEAAPVVHLGAYARPKAEENIKEITKNDICNLVMPGEDWCVSFYPVPRDNTGKIVYVISETILNSNLVEIVRKSITIQPNWAMKFSVMSLDASHFNLGLGCTDITDIQSVLDTFDVFPVCRGLTTVAVLKTKPQLEEKVTLFPDKMYRSKECTLLVVKNNSSQILCPACSKVFSNFL